MITTNPEQPHDSRAETRTQHEREEAAQSMAEPIADAIRDGLTPTPPEVTRARLWPTLPPVELREERGLWDGPAHVVSAVCPSCKGVPEHPEIEGCKGCGACDYKGTLAGHAEMKALEAEMWQGMADEAKAHKAYIAKGVCSQCGACNRNEAGSKCTASSSDESGEYSCDGEDLWPEPEYTPSQRPTRTETATGGGSPAAEETC